MTRSVWRGSYEVYASFSVGNFACSDFLGNIAMVCIIEAGREPGQQNYYHQWWKHYCERWHYHETWHLREERPRYEGRRFYKGRHYYEGGHNQQRKPAKDGTQHLSSSTPKALSIPQALYTEPVTDPTLCYTRCATRTSF